MRRLNKIIFKNQVFRGAIIYTITDVVNKVIPFLLLPILTLYLSPSDYGIVSTYGALVGILAVFIHLSMAGAIGVSFFTLSKTQLRVYIANSLIIAIVMTIIIFIIIVLFHAQLISWFKIPLEWLIISVFIALSQLLTLINLELWQVEQKAKFFGVYQITQVLVYTSMILIFVVGFTLKSEGYLISLAVSTILFALVSLYIIHRREYLFFKVDENYIKDILTFGIPLIPHALSGWFKTGADRILLTTLIGTAATGLYSLAYQFGLIIGVLTIAFNQAFSPYLYKSLSSITIEEKIRLVKLTYLYFFGVLVLALGACAVMPLFIHTFLDERYYQASEYLPWIFFGFAFQGMYYMVVNYIFFVKKNYWLAAVTFSTGLLHVIISYIFINMNGAIGAAQATTISSFITFILVWILSNKVYSMPWFLSFSNNKGVVE